MKMLEEQGEVIQESGKLTQVLLESDSMFGRYVKAANDDCVTQHLDFTISKQSMSI